MRVKKILAATLAGTMFFSGIAFTEVGATEVQAISGESQIAGRIAGQNIANNSGIVAYSGEEDRTHLHTYLMDGTGNNGVNDDSRWLSGVELKNGVTPIEGNTAYIVYDLGENGPRSYEGMKLRFHNKAFATKYKIYTKDTNNYDSMQTSIDPESDGWRVVDTFERENYDRNTTYPLDELGKQTGLDRYILFCFTDMNLRGGTTVSNQISIREIEIYHQAITSITLPESKDMTVGASETLEVTIAPSDATYQDVVWSVETIKSADESEGDVVTVSDEGQVTANRPGKACVTVTAKDDVTKTASCVVTVQENKGDLNLAIEEASKLVQDNYTEESWMVFADALEGAKGVQDDIFATRAQIEGAINTLMEAQNALVRVYKVTVVNGDSTTVVDRGEYGKFVTVIAPEAPEGQIFAGWKNGDVTVSTKESYSFYLVGDVTLTATYQNAGQEVVQSPGAMLSNVLFKETTAGKYRVSFVCQLSMPEGYELQEAGVFWSKTNMSSLHNEDGTAASGARKVNAKSTNNQYQYVININNVPLGFTLYQEVFAKVKNTATGEFSWVYTTVTPVKVP